MRKLLIKTAVLVMAACLAGCPSPGGGGNPPVDPPGTGRFAYTVWVDESGNLLTDVIDAPYISTSDGEERTFTITASADLANVQWFLNGNPLGGAASSSITIDALSYITGDYTLGLYAEKDGIPYSTTITFTVDNG
jgi:hypothetical protein